MFKTLSKIFIEDSTYKVFEEKLSHMTLRDFWALDRVPVGVDEKLMAYTSNYVKEAFEHFRNKNKEVLDDEMTVGDFLTAYEVSLMR
jgi:tyrosine-protein phosphatase YwqE